MTLVVGKCFKWMRNDSMVTERFLSIFGQKQMQLHKLKNTVERRMQWESNSDWYFSVTISLYAFLFLSLFHNKWPELKRWETIVITLLDVIGFRYYLQCIFVSILFHLFHLFLKVEFFGPAKTLVSMKLFRRQIFATNARNISVFLWIDCVKYY